MKDKCVKINNFIKRHDNVFVIMLIFLSILGISLDTAITNSDELWNFQNIYKMYNGFRIYKDANVIVTPLFFIIGELLFKVFGANFLVFRFYNIIIMVSIYFITYLILKKLAVSKKIAIIILLSLIVYKNFGLTLIQANYNTMALMLCLLGIFINLKNVKNNSIYQGIVLFLICIAKQNMGIYYGIGLFFYELIKCNEIKIKIKKLITEFVVFIAFLLFFIFYMYVNNNLYDFINFSILGIKEFAKENIAMSYLSIITMTSIISINTILTLFFCKNKKVKLNEIEKQNLILLNCFSIPLVFIMFPIFNQAHYLIGIYASLILFVYIIKLMMDRIDLKIKPKITSYILLGGSILIIIISNVYLYSWNYIINSKEYTIDKKSPFYGGIISKELEKNIDNIVNYIKNEKENVIVLSNKAALYMIPLKRSNGMMDLPFKGNLGKRGEEGLLEEIKSMQNTKILIEKDEKEMSYQESKLVRQYIMDNMERIGEIEEFYIYKKT